MKRANHATYFANSDLRTALLRKLFLHALLALLATLGATAAVAAMPNPAKPAGLDRLTFINGDSLTGTFEREVGGNVYFHADELGELTVPWKNIRTLSARGSFAVLETTPGVHRRHVAAEAIQGTVAVKDNTINVHPGVTTGAAAVKTVPVKRAEFILDQKTFRRQLIAEPNVLQGWNGSLAAGGSLVRGTENQYTYTSAVTLARSVPTVDWLPTRNRTLADFSSSYGRIVQPAYTDDGVFVPLSSTKSSIFHADSERDEYVSRRVFALAQTAFDHNYSQGLDLQQIYGAGFGVTAIKRSTEQLDLKANLQYEKQTFITTASGTNQDLVGSTLSGTYLLTLHDHVVFHQQVEYIPAYNIVRDYSADETDSLTVPFYKELSFTIGTIDSYLNDPVLAEPPTKRNSFQFTTGVTYTIKSRY